MGQKVNQSVFRLGVKNSKWDYKYLEKTPEESSLLLYKNINIINYINNTLKFYGILLHNCKVEYTKTSINIIIYFFDLKTYKKKIRKKKLISFIITKILPISLSLYTKNHQINIKTKNLNNKYKLNSKKNEESKYNKIIKTFKRFLKDRYYRNLIKIMIIVICEKNSSSLLSEYISICVNKHRKRHGYLLFILKKCFNTLISSKFSKIKGVKIEISGRINGAPRAKTKRVQVGSVPLQSFDSSISYHNSTSYTLNGSFGVKVWICEK